MRTKSTATCATLWLLVCLAVFSLLPGGSAQTKRRATLLVRAGGLQRTTASPLENGRNERVLVSQETSKARKVLAVQPDHSWEEHLARHAVNQVLGHEGCKVMSVTPLSEEAVIGRKKYELDIQLTGCKYASMIAVVQERDGEKPEVLRYSTVKVPTPSDFHKSALSFPLPVPVTIPVYIDVPRPEVVPVPNVIPINIPVIVNVPVPVPDYVGPRPAIQCVPNPVPIPTPVPMPVPVFQGAKKARSLIDRQSNSTVEEQLAEIAVTKALDDDRCKVTKVTPVKDETMTGGKKYTLAIQLSGCKYSRLNAEVQALDGMEPRVLSFSTTKPGAKAAKSPVPSPVPVPVPVPVANYVPVKTYSPYPVYVPVAIPTPSPVPFPGGRAPDCIPTPVPTPVPIPVPGFVLAPVPDPVPTPVPVGKKAARKVLAVQPDHSWEEYLARTAVKQVDRDCTANSITPVATEAVIGRTKYTLDVNVGGRGCKYSRMQLQVEVQDGEKPTLVGYTTVLSPVQPVPMPDIKADKADVERLARIAVDTLLDPSCRVGRVRDVSQASVIGRSWYNLNIDVSGCKYSRLAVEMNVYDGKAKPEILNFSTLLG